MVEKLIIDIEQEMINLLNNMQMEKLHKVLLKKLQGLTFIDGSSSKSLENEEVDYCNIFICAKRVEGCSEKFLMCLMQGAYVKLFKLCYNYY